MKLPKQESKYNSNLNIVTGDRIKRTLKDKGITQVDFCQNKFFCDPTVFSRKLNGTKKFSNEELLKISKLLKVDLLYLLGETDDPNHSKNISEQIMKSFTNEEEQFFKENEGIIKYLKSLGYDIDIIGGSGGYNEESKQAYSHIHLGISKDGVPIHGYDADSWNTFKDKLKLLVEFTLLG